MALTSGPKMGSALHTWEGRWAANKAAGPLALSPREDSWKPLGAAFSVMLLARVGSHGHTSLQKKAEKDDLYNWWLIYSQVMCYSGRKADDNRGIRGAKMMFQGSSPTAVYAARWWGMSVMKEAVYVCVGGYVNLHYSQFHFAVLLTLSLKERSIKKLGQKWGVSASFL